MTFLSTILAAGGTGGAGGVNIQTPTGGITTISEFNVSQIISWAVTAILVVAGLIFFFMLIIGGLRYILSGGDKTATESARGQITAALIGLVIVFSAWAIASLLQAVFGFSILNLEIPGIASFT
jgi:hypothetical protein